MLMFIENYGCYLEQFETKVQLKRFFFKKTGGTKLGQMICWS